MFQIHFIEWKWYNFDLIWSLFVFWSISKFVHKGPIDNKSPLIQLMAWRRTGAKPLPEPMMAQTTGAIY